jgi:hypothetical protein
MRAIKYIALSAAAALCLALSPAAHQAEAQVSFGVNIGAPPVCPYGYYDYAPYNCAPYGYYGPEWFNGGVFIGAGPWFHGPHGFYGHVDNHYDPHYGYHGALPGHGHAAFHAYGGGGFHGNAMADGHGHRR